MGRWVCHLRRMAQAHRREDGRRTSRRRSETGPARSESESPASGMAGPALSPRQTPRRALTSAPVPCRSTPLAPSAQTFRYSRGRRSSPTVRSPSGVLSRRDCRHRGPDTPAGPCPAPVSPAPMPRCFQGRPLRRRRQPPPVRARPCRRPASWQRGPPAPPADDGPVRRSGRGIPGSELGSDRQSSALVPFARWPAFV